MVTLKIFIIIFCMGLWEVNAESTKDLKNIKDSKVVVKTNTVDFKVVKPNIFEHVERTFEDFISFSNSSLLAAITKLEEIVDDILNLKVKTDEIVEYQLKSMTDCFLNQVRGLETQSKKFSDVNVSDCENNATSSSAVIKALPNFALKAVGDCFELSSVVILNEIASASETLDRLPERWIHVFSVYLRQCKENHASLQAACAANLGTKISEVKVNYTNTIEELISKIVGLTPNLNNVAVNCSTNQLASVSSKAALVVADITHCANRLMLGAKSKSTTASNTTTTTTPPNGDNGDSALEEVPE